MKETQRPTAMHFASRLIGIPLALTLSAAAQRVNPNIPLPGERSHVPLQAKGITEPDEPAHLEPAATDFKDPQYKVSFHVPAGWNFTRHDGDLSSLRRDVRSSRSNLQLRGVASINYNPYPVSTFANATFYFTVVPKADAASCAAQANSGDVKPQTARRVADTPFNHGYDQHGVICTESRDNVYTAMRGRTCMRFDLVVNTFCSQTSGAMEISPQQLGDVDHRLANILDSVRIGN